MYKRQLNTNGDTNLGNATSDTITATGRFDSHLIPATDSLYDLGSSTLEWSNLFLDGTAHIDTLDVDGNAGIVGNLTVTGSSEFNNTLAGDGNFGGNVIVKGNTSVSGNIDTAGNTSIGGTLTATGATQLGSTVTVVSASM